MVSKTIEVEVELDIFDVFRDMTRNEVIENIIDVDNMYADWGFSVDLLTKLIESMPFHELYMHREQFEEQYNKFVDLLKTTLETLTDDSK